MSRKSLPAYLQQVLQDHVDHSELTYDAELQSIFDKLSRLNDSVEQIKARVREKKQTSSS